MIFKIIKQSVKTSLLCSAFLSLSSYGVEQSFSGIVDARLFKVNNSSEFNSTDKSYLLGGYGKFDNKKISGFRLAQLGIQYRASWENNLSLHLIANAFSNKEENNIGLTEAFIRYKGLPSKSGWRIQSKAGFFYPNISMENNATAWSNPYTLNNSTLNTWVGEELRHSGFQISLDKLGKFTNNKHDLSLDLTLFKNNDTAGAMLSWHGWTSASRQSLFQEKLKLQNFPARKPGRDLASQAAFSDPFLELDNRWGAHIVGHWRYQNKVKINLGYYDNNTDLNIVKNGQYTWATRFTHAGIKIKLAEKVELISQYMRGRTAMQGKNGRLVVNNNYNNAFIMLRKYWGLQHLAIRLEEFSVDDLDSTWGDHNQEYGKGLTLSYRYRMNKHSFVQTEYNWLQSNRLARHYVNQDRDLIERQVQLALRYYF